MNSGTAVRSTDLSLGTVQFVRADSLNLAQSFLRLASLPNFAFDRLSRYEASLWRQADQIMFTLEHLARYRR
jgi:hypothetical protein